MSVQGRVLLLVFDPLNRIRLLDSSFRVSLFSGRGCRGDITFLLLAQRVKSLWDGWLHIRSRDWSCSEDATLASRSRGRQKSSESGEESVVASVELGCLTCCHPEWKAAGRTIFEWTDMFLLNQGSNQKTLA